MFVTLGDVMSHLQKLTRSCRQEARVMVSTGINRLLIRAEGHDLQFGLSMENVPVCSDTPTKCQYL